MTQNTIIPESIGEKIVKGIKEQGKTRKMLMAITLLVIILVAGYSVGYIQGYHDALIDFEIIAGRVVIL